MSDSMLITQLRETAQACLALADRLADRLEVSEAPTQIIPTPPPQRLAEDAFIDGYPMEPPRV